MAGTDDKPNPLSASSLPANPLPAKPWRGWGTTAVVVPLFAILAASVWFAARAFTAVEGPPMPPVGYVAMTLGVVFSVVLGFGLMALLFYSSRHGYDEPPHTETDAD
jgi:hypothetical protein